MPTADQTEIEIEKLVRRFIEGMTSGKTEILDDVLADDFVGHAPAEVAHEEEAQDKARLAQEAGRMKETFPDLEGTLHDLVAEGDRVALRWSATGTHEGPLMSIPATGKRVTIRGMNVLRIANGKIAEDWVLWDVMDLMRQLGVAPGSRGTGEGLR